MTPVFIVIWMIIGLGLALMVFLSQHWTVRTINPNRAGLSKWLVIGGAFIRWMILSLVFFKAISSSLGALLIVFFTFLFSRLLILIIWQRQLNSSQVIKPN